MVSLELPVWHQEFTLELIQNSLQDRLKHSGGLVRMPLPVGLGEAGTVLLDLNVLVTATKHVFSFQKEVEVIAYVFATKVELEVSHFLLLN